MVSVVVTRRRPPGWALAMWAGIVLLLVLLATVPDRGVEVVSSALAGAVTGLAAWTALDLGRARKNLDVRRVREAEFVEFAEAIELRVEHAESELGAAMVDVRRDSVSAVHALRDEVGVLRRSLEAFMASSRREPGAGHVRTPRPTSLDLHIDEIIGSLGRGATREAAEKAAGTGIGAGEARRGRVGSLRARPVSDIPGLDEAQVLRLHSLGIHDTVQLCAADPVDVARRLRVWPNLVRNWQVSAELLPVRTAEPART